MASAEQMILGIEREMARDFNVGKIDRDQVDDYHRRKGMDLRAVERWLRPILNYDADLEEPLREPAAVPVP